MKDRVVWTFFYGSYMNFDVLKEVDLVPDDWKKAKLSGYDIQIRPRANIVRSENDWVFGIVATTTHAELNRLYAHARDVLGEVYLPEAVLLETFNGEWIPALCYVCSEMEPRLAENEYIDRIAGSAREYGFPGWYVEHIESFRPQ